MNDLTERGVGREEIYGGKVLRVVKDRVVLPNGRESEREFCIHIGAVAVIPLLSDGRVIMERQYRYAHGRTFLEIPAGKLDFSDEPPLSAAKRELLEETGAVADSYTFLGELDTTPAITNEKIYTYLARGITFSERSLDEDEFIDLEFIHIDKLYEMVMSGEIKDSKTQIAVLKTKEILRNEEK